MNKHKYIVTLVGYTDDGNTNFYPFRRFYDAFRVKGYRMEWKKASQLNDTNPRILICWNDPTAKDLYESGKVKKNDILLQKLTSLGKGDDHINWGKDPLNFFKNWKWHTYKRVEDLYDLGVNVYAFGCRTNTELFPEKHRIYQKIKDRVFWVPWGSSAYNYEEVQECKPVMDGFKYDVAYVGSKWGVVGRGNIDAWQQYMEPIIRGRSNKCSGRGFPGDRISDTEQKKILKHGKICPIINAPSWRVEEGVQDRFWTVFTTGRFGVVDSEGIYEFYNKDEVVCETDPGEFIEKNLYYLKNVDKQLPYILKAQKRIKEEYNWYDTWDKIITKIIMEN